MYSPTLSTVSRPASWPLSITGSVRQLQSFSLAKADSRISRESTVTMRFCIAVVSVGWCSRAASAPARSQPVLIHSIRILITNAR